MMRKIIFTEQQLKHILGEDFESYLPKDGLASEEPSNSFGTEIGVSDKNSDGESIDTPVTDKIGKSVTPGYALFRHTSGLAESKKKVNEENHELMNHSYNLGKNINSQINSAASMNPKDKLMQNMNSEKNMKHGTAKKRKHDLEQMQKDDPQRFENIGGDKILNGIDQKLKNDTEMSRRHKETKKNVLGQDNAFQKAGGTKNTNKQNFSITYEY